MRADHVAGLHKNSHGDNALAGMSLDGLPLGLVPPLVPVDKGVQGVLSKRIPIIAAQSPS